MAAGTVEIDFSNGQHLSIYSGASQAVNSYSVCSLTGTASSATTTYDFTLLSDATITDILCTVSVSGQIEFQNMNTQERGGRIMTSVTTYVITNVNRIIPRIKLKGGVPYRIVQTVIQA
jgi:hypothetical protein